MPDRYFPPTDVLWCDPSVPERFAWYASVVTPTYCATPDTSLTCFTVTTMRYDGGAHPNTVHTDLVFVSDDGSVVDVSAVLARHNIDADAAQHAVEQMVCQLDRDAELIDDDCWPVTLRNVRPTTSGAIFSFAPYESGPYAFGPRDPFIPWTTL